MFPLDAQDFPTSSEALARDIEQTLRRFVSLPEPRGGVAVSGEDFPQVQALKVDLSGGAIREDVAAPPPPSDAQRRPGFSARELSIAGRGVRFRGSRFDLALSANDVAFDFARSGDHRPWLMLAGAKSGHVELSVGMDDLRALVLQVVRDLAEPHRVTVESMALSLTSRGARSADLDARFVAKKMLLRGTVRVRGVLEIDEQLSASVDNLSASGEGAVGSIAAGMIQPKLKALEGRRLSLMGLGVGAAGLRDLRIDAGEAALRVTADFGAAAPA